MATMNSRESVSTTARRPPNALKTTVTKEAMMIVCEGVKPSITCPILMAASETEAMMQMLKNTPR